MVVDIRPSPIKLGNFEFLLYEVPENVRYGGPEHIEIHRQPGGQRQIDILGRDDDPYVWRGMLLSADAEARSLQLQQMKVAGLIYPLQFGAVDEDVVISKLIFIYRKPNFIEYEIECTPVINGDQAAQVANGVQNGINNAGNILGGAGP